MKKFICMFISVLIATTMVMPVSAVEKSENIIDYTNKIEVKAERDLSNDVLPYGLFDDYNVYSGGSWVMDGLVGVGAKGWTNIVEKSDGTYRYHYTNVAVYADHDENTVYTSGREWGSGKVEASTGDLGEGAMHHYRIFYGW
ncbi:hypothetical protein JYG23_13920 [Sedimentibacter sp. zth1]|uniref:hypothetical protein n=1 Tax=Sedimentibacter sp. zth1 TaxID=2816908 RepID=UPI001A912AFE|nr:hypothetical protein [Sedimentibacter sp. zth1]QSX05742.1 hypothetical protein JYG23_13920 [Sedimentibacter sp. zth1]